MPQFEITSPEGKRYRVTAPEGATKEDALAYVQKNFSAEQVQRGPIDKLFGIGGERYQTWPERLVRDIGSQFMQGAETFKKGMSGELGPPGSREFTESAATGLAGPAALGVTPAPGAAAALARPVENLGERLSRTYPERLEEQAVRKVQTRIEQDVKAGGPTAQEALDHVAQANATGKPMTLADVGGRNVRSLAGNVARAPGASRGIAETALYGRDAEAAQRLSGDVARFVYGGPSMHQSVEALLQARSSAGRPAYEAMQQLEGIWSPRLQQFLDDSVVKRGMARGYEIERLESLAEGRPFDPTQLGVDLDAEGNIQILKTPNMRVLDMAKQGLDAMIADERNEITGRLTNRGVALEKVRKAYVTLLDDLDTSGTYKAARQSWAGYSKSLDSVRAGRTIFSNSPEQIAADFAKLSPNDQEFYRLGVADLLRERLAKTAMTGDEAKSIIRNPWVRDQLRPIFHSNADFDKFTEAVTAESRMHGTMRSVLGGSQTAERLAEDTSQENFMSMGGAEIAKNLASGEWFSAIRKYLRMKRDLGIRQNPELNERIAKLLFSTNPDLTVAAPSRGNYLEGAASKLRGATPAMVPGAASGLMGQQ